MPTKSSELDFEDRCGEIEKLDRAIRCSVSSGSVADFRGGPLLPVLGARLSVSHRRPNRDGRMLGLRMQVFLQMQ